MQYFFDILRILHILAGSLALVAGPIAMMNQNGGKLHRAAGKIYFYAMLFIVGSALYMSIYHQNFFLLMIAIFTLHAVSTGVRSLKLKKLHRGQKPAVIDWTIQWVAAAFNVCLILWGIWMLYHNNSFGVLGIVFGFIMSRAVISDYKRFTVPSQEKNEWLFIHIGRMMGGYIATMTAFLVQNVHTNPAFIAWLLPTVVFVPFLIYTVNKFKGKVKRQEPVPAQVED
ncbi:hypothetical protein BH11BAC2_BH11BAC2_01520 [soil metagenome]